MENKKNMTTRQLIETIRLHQELKAFEGKLDDYLAGSNRGEYSLRRDLTPLINKIEEAIEILKDGLLKSQAWNDLEGFD